MRDAVAFLQNKAKDERLAGNAELANDFHGCAAQIKRLRADLATFGKDTVATENRIIDAEFSAQEAKAEIERLRAENAELRLAKCEFDKCNRMIAALDKIAKMKPSEIAPKIFPGLVHGPALLFANSQRIARAALRGHQQKAPEPK